MKMLDQEEEFWLDKEWYLADKAKVRDSSGQDFLLLIHCKVNYGFHIQQCSDLKPYFVTKRLSR